MFRKDVFSSVAIVCLTLLLSVKVRNAVRFYSKDTNIFSDTYKRNGAARFDRRKPVHQPSTPKKGAAKKNLTEKDFAMHSREIFVYYLPDDVGEKELSRLFKKFGKVRSARIIVDPETGKSRCFGIVAFSRPYSAQSAAQHMNGKPVGSKRIEVEIKISKRQMIELLNNRTVESFCSHKRHDTSELSQTGDVPSGDAGSLNSVNGTTRVNELLSPIPIR